MRQQICSGRSPRKKIKAFKAIFEGHRQIGLELQPKKRGGIMIKKVHANSPAEEQGLLKGMSLLKIDYNLEDLTSLDTSY